MAQTSPKSERDLVRIVHFSSALSLGTLAGLLYSVKTVTPTIEFRLTAAAPVAFALAAAASVAFWSVVFKLNEETATGEPAPQGRRLRLGLLAGLLALGLVLSFVYPLKDFSSEKAGEIGFGAFIALGFLSILGVLFWRVVRYLESQN